MNYTGAFLIVFCSGVATISCGSGDEGGGPDRGSKSMYSCCLNDVNYSCPNMSAFQACVGFDVAACHGNCSLSDFDCHMMCDQKSATAQPDPSQCTQKPGPCPTL